jgi:hypothetical protein
VIYSFSTLWHKMPMPYVRFPISERRKNRRESPALR